MEIKYFGKDESEDRVVNVPDETPASTGVDDDVEKFPGVDMRRIQEAFFGLLILLAIVATVTALGVYVYKATRGC